MSGNCQPSLNVFLKEMVDLKCTQHGVNDDNSTIWRQYHIKAHKGYVAIPILLLGLILVNNTLIVLTLKRVKNKLFTDIFMTGLAVADFAVSIPLSITVVTFINGVIVMSEFLCDIWALGVMGGIATTIWLHGAICIEKCVFITRPLQHRLFLQKEYSNRVAYGVIAVCMFFPSGYILALVYSGVLRHADFDALLVVCHFDLNMKFLLTVGNVFLTSSLIVQLVTYALILRQVSISAIQRKKRIFCAIKTVLRTLGAYYMCIGPAAVFMVWSAASDNAPPPEIKFAAYYILLSNSCMNFFIYLSSMPRFREAFTKMIGYHSQKSSKQIHVHGARATRV